MLIGHVAQGSAEHGKKHETGCKFVVADALKSLMAEMGETPIRETR